ncbi:DUF1080 domain-containing protein [Kribbella sp. NPDC026611]|uniref:DUF1080 domain-containing protein n=1 Tax=Kribbella sp. NPDC026611 TaxID=3154911 RepID=UPI0033ED4D56
MAFSSLESPNWLDQVSAIPLPDGDAARLADDEIRQAFDELSDWTGGDDHLRRRVVLPPGGLLPEVEAVLRDDGHVESSEDSLLIIVNRSADAVTSYDVDLARRVEEVLVSMGAAIARLPGITGRWCREPQVLLAGTVMVGWRMCGAGGFDLVDASVQSRGGLGMLWYAEGEFTDFVLTLDWRVAHASDVGGVFVRFPDPGDDPWVALTDGYEVQLCDGRDGTEGTGAICGLQAPYADPSVKPPGEWNHLEIQARGDVFRVGVNGREVTAFSGSRADSGYVGVQNHDTDSRVQYRNIKVFFEGAAA